jgi:hypothetical protein
VTQCTCSNSSPAIRCFPTPSFFIDNLRSRYVDFSRAVCLPSRQMRAVQSPCPAKYTSVVRPGRAICSRMSTDVRTQDLKTVRCTARKVCNSGHLYVMALVDECVSQNCSYSTRCHPFKATSICCSLFDVVISRLVATSVTLTCSDMGSTLFV